MTETQMTGAAIKEKVRALMPELTSDLVNLSRIPSISSTTEVSDEVLQAHDLVVELLHGAGVTHLQSLALPGTAPVIVGEIPAPEGAPTVLLYSHYDVVPAGDESLWSSPPFEPTERDGALFGRGASDSKANVIAHVGALRAWDGRPPVGIKLVIEGQEEVGGGDLMNYARSNPAAFASDAMIIADAGSVRPGVPTLTIGLRGMAQIEIEVSTLAGAKHSGQYGGAAPDALVVLIQALAALHDENGDVAVPGLRREEWSGTDYSDEEFRALAEINDGLPFQGTGGLGSRLWSGPAITVTGIDAPSVANALNAVQPHAAARLNVRVHPAQDATEAQAAVVSFLEGLKPFGVPLEGDRARDRQRLPRRDLGPGLRRRERGNGDRLGRRDGDRRDGRLDPARERSRGGSPRRRDPAPRSDRRLQQHPRPGRARDPRRVREDDRRRGRVLPALRRAAPRLELRRPNALHAARRQTGVRYRLNLGNESARIPAASRGKSGDRYWNESVTKRPHAWLRAACAENDDTRGRQAAG